MHSTSSSMTGPDPGGTTGRPETGAGAAGALSRSEPALRTGLSREEPARTAGVVAGSPAWRGFAPHAPPGGVPAWVRVCVCNQMRSAGFSGGGSGLLLQLRPLNWPAFPQGLCFGAELLRIWVFPPWDTGPGAAHRAQPCVSEPGQQSLAGRHRPQRRSGRGRGHAVRTSQATVPSWGWPGWGPAGLPGPKAAPPRASVAFLNPRPRQTTLASSRSHRLSHTVPHWPP